MSKVGLTPARHSQAKALAANWEQTPTPIAMSPYLRTHLTASSAKRDAQKGASLGSPSHRS
jgi:broad specificity phosphatase PhoE